MRYLSLFSGIGGFEVAIHRVFGHRAVCVGYSEIDKHAIAEYTRHYPTHRNLGDVRQIKKHEIDKLGKIDLVVAGFPCSDLSSVRHKDRRGLDGDKSGLFWTMLDILSWVRKNNADVQIVIENNVSMAHKWRDMITKELSCVFHKPVYCNYFDASQWVPQRRRRFYWTLRPIPQYQGSLTRDKMMTFTDPIHKTKHLHVSDDIVYRKNAPYSQGKKGIWWDKKARTFCVCGYKTRWLSSLSVLSKPPIKCITTTYHDNILLDTRTNTLRYFSKQELNKVFGYPAHYVQTDAITIYYKLFGMSIVPGIIVYILENIMFTDSNAP